jgi:uncharacterized DUF497 family protein
VDQANAVNVRLLPADRPRAPSLHRRHEPTVERLDERFEYGEVRTYAIGLVNGIEITVISECEPDERHIISAWRSEPHQRRCFWNDIED